MLIIVALLQSVLPAAESGKLMDVHDIIQRARESLFQNGVTRIAYSDSDYKKWTKSEYYYKNKDGDKFVYKKSILDDGKYTSSLIMLVRPDGDWRLFQDVAIRQPDEMAQILRAKNSICYPSKSVVGLVEDGLENGEPCTRILFDFSEEDRDALARSVMGEVVQQAKLLSPSRCEVLISKNTGIIIAERLYSKNGKKLSEIKITAIEKNCDFPVSNFSISKDCKILLPKNVPEYSSLTDKYREITKNNKTTNKGTKK